jgi:O-antigen/teichoic acid export membrane protein
MRGQVMSGFVSLLAGTIVVRALSFAAAVLVIRAVGPADYGVFAFALALATVFAVAAHFGVDDLLVKDVARRGPDQSAALIGNAILLRLAAIPFGLAITAVLVLRDPGNAALYSLLAVYGVLHSYLLLMCAVARGRGQPRTQALLLSLQMTLIAATSVAASWLNSSVTLVAVGYAVSTALTVLVGFRLVLRSSARLRLTWELPALVRAGAPFGVTLVGFLVLDRLALLAVASLRSDVETGWFSAAYGLVLTLTNLPMAAAGAAYPLLARNPKEAPRVTGDLLRYTLLAGLGLAIALYGAAPLLVPLLFGPRFEPAIEPLKVLAVSLPPFFVSLVLIVFLEATDHQRACATAIVQTLLIAAPLTLLGTWQWGLGGAAVAYVATHGLLVLTLAERVYRRVPRRVAYG